MTQLDGSDIDLSSTDDEYKDIKYVPEPNKSSSNSELRFSDTDEPDTIPSINLSSLAKQLKGKKKKKSLSATALRSTVLRF